MRDLILLVLVGFLLIAVWMNRTDVPSDSNTQIATVDFVLAISWQPAFCEKNPNKPECNSQTNDRFDANAFSLHGLWPQPRNRTYCGAPPKDRVMDRTGKWSQISQLDLSDPLRDELRKKMPGYQSFLHRHEWVKHGTCISGITPQRYFETSLRLLDDVNNSALRRLFETKIGQEIDARSIQRAMNKAFGRRAGNQVRIACKQDGSRRIISELTIGLTGDINQSGGVASLIADGPPTDTGCPGGIVDPAGLQ